MALLLCFLKSLLTFAFHVFFDSTVFILYLFPVLLTIINFSFILRFVFCMFDHFSIILRKVK